MPPGSHMDGRFSEIEQKSHDHHDRAVAKGRNGDDLMSDFGDLVVFMTTYISNQYLPDDDICSK